MRVENGWLVFPDNSFVQIRNIAHFHRDGALIRVRTPSGVYHFECSSEQAAITVADAILANALAEN